MSNVCMCGLVRACAGGWLWQGTRTSKPWRRHSATFAVTVCVLAGCLQDPQDTTPGMSEPVTPGTREPVTGQLAIDGPQPVMAETPGTVDAPVAVLLEDEDPHLARLLAQMLAAARSDPRSGESRGRLAMAYEVNGFTDAALATYAQATVLDSTESKWPYLRAMLLWEMGDHESALDSLDKSVAVDAGYIPAWLWRGAWLLERGEYQKAAVAFDRATELGGGAAATIGLARTRLQQKRHDEVVALLEPAVAEMPHPYIHRLLGSAYRALGRSEEARIALARGRRGPQDRAWLWPDLHRATLDLYIGGFTGRLTRAENLLAIGAGREALSILETLYQDRPNHPALLSGLGHAYAQVGRLERARAVLQHGIDASPDNYYLHRLISAIHHQRGDTSRALRHMHRAQELIPERGSDHEWVGRMLMDLGRHDEALASLDRALRYGVRNPEHVLYTAGMIEMRRERWIEAAGRFRQAVRINETLTPAQVELAHCLGELGRYREAEAVLLWAEKLADQPREVNAARRRLAELQAQSSARSG